MVYRKKPYINPHCDNSRRKLKDILLWQIGYYNDRFVPPEPPKEFAYPNPDASVDFTEPQVMWINHCTFMVSIDGINILTDPIWSNRCSPLPFLGPRRKHPPALMIEELPRIDVVFVSHNHYDHLDKKTTKELIKRNPHLTWVVPYGLKKWFRKLGAMNLIELKWWEDTTISIYRNPELQMQITAVPCQHFSGRGIFDKNKTLWCGFVIDFLRKEKKRKRLYFVGDTGYNEHDFKKIGEVFGGMDLSLIPIGTYVPNRFMSPVHICPFMATNIHQEVKSKLSVGMHWKTYRLSSEEEYQPPYDLYMAMTSLDLNPLHFRVIEPGQRINW